MTATTAKLLSYWTNPDREKPLFFCQIEAVETAIDIAEVARKCGDAWIENDLRAANPGLPRLSLKMATGSGKTVVMGMVIACQHASGHVPMSIPGGGHGWAPSRRSGRGR